MLWAITAAVAFGFASFLQAQGAQHQCAGSPLRQALQLLRNPVFLSGCALDVVGFGLTALAVRHLPLFVVEAVLAGTVVVTALCVRAIAHKRMARLQALGLSVFIAGLAATALSIPDDAGRSVDLPISWLVLAAMSTVALTVGLIEARLKAPLAIVAGACFGLWAASSRLHADGASATAVGGALVVTGLLAFGCATRGSELVGMTALTIAAEGLTATLVGMLLGDSARPGYGLLASFGWCATIAAACVMAATRDAHDSVQTALMAPVQVAPQSTMR